MFEAHVLHLLRRYLGEYVHGLSAEALRISVWKGDVVLKDLKLKAEALNSLKLPVTVKAGFVGTITLKVPWKSLGKEPVIVLIDRVFVLAYPAPNERTLKEEDREKLFEAKLQQIEDAVSATLEAKANSKPGSPVTGNSWLGSLIGTIIGNLKISISNVHIRYEDSVSNAGNPFSMGFTLAKLAAVTMDEQGKETFDASGALDNLRKSLQLERLAMYHDSNTVPWKINKKWESLNPNEWIEIFEDGINESVTGDGVMRVWALNRRYLVSPINGDLKYHRVGNQERSDPEIPFEKATLVLSDVSLTITEGQYHDWIKLLEAISSYNTYVEVSHLRPVVPISNGAKLWWHYAFQAVLYQRKLFYRFTWDQIRHLSQLRRQYVQLYASSLQEPSDINNSEIRNIEKDLDSKVIILWRLLAHAKAELVKSKEASQKRKQRSGSWFSFSWKSTSDCSSVEGISEEPKLLEEKLTKEEWQTINKLLSYQPDEELALRSGKDMNNMIHFFVIVSIGKAAARIISRNQIEIICGRFEQLHVSTKFKHRSTHCDVLLKFYGLSAPEGSLAQSVCSEQKVNALAASFVLSPVGENVDWKLSAIISPCHATILMESYDRLIEFMRRSNAVSPSVVIETATALQMKFEKVTRRAQKQFQMVLEQQSRFALDIDFDAPKVRVPIKGRVLSDCDINFLLDLGHFTLQTKESHCDDQRQSLYSRFYIYGRDIAAFFTNCSSSCQNCTSVSPCYGKILNPSGIQEYDNNYYSLIDKCGMAVVVDQIKIPHPCYPSTRVSVQVPNLGIHFSPDRYCRIVELLYMLYGTVESSLDADSSQGDLVPWGPVDLASEAKILVWKGIGNSVAAWYPCFLVLSDSYLYVLESEKSQTYQRCSSMGGKQVYVVPPTKIGGSRFCIAVGIRGLDIQKVLESSTTLVIKFEEEEENALWMKGLVHSTYRASPSLLLDVPEESSAGDSEFAEPQVTNFKTADLVINGALLEAKVFIYGKVADDIHEDLETLIVELRAAGAKVHIVRLDTDLTIKMKLHSLKIKDQLLGTLSAEHPQYLACSVLKNDNLYASPHSIVCSGESPVTNLDEDENFKDALPSFITLPDQMIHSKNIDIVQGAKMGSSSSMDCTGVSSPGVRDFSEEIFYEVNDIDNSDFVSVIFSTRNPASTNYVGIDTEMSIRMSKLKLYCNRPTVVALISFGLDISSLNSGLSVTNTENSLDGESLVNKEKTEEICCPSVKGLLGYGKDRVVFLLIMNVDNVTVFLNKEDGSQLSMFVQERFILDLKVHPSSLSIEGTLGNLRLSDMSLGTDYCWGWLCDIRNPGAESLITFNFNSYSADDDDYDGYDYSLSGRLSAVRIIFLYRFVQEIMAYFMDLATPHTEEAIKLVDKVGDLEWWIQKSEIDGTSALKLDLSLETPMIIVPRNSTSKEFIQLDLGHLSIRNEFCWHGIHEKDPSSVHLDVIHIEILGINMAVGVDGCGEKPMIQEMQGFDVFVQHSLRDIFRKVPTFSVEVKVGLLHVLMSEKEYKIILDCACMNLCEEPRLPLSFRRNTSGSKDAMRLLADKVNMNSLAFLSRNVTVVCVEVNYALLELCTGFQEISPLAHLALENLWVSYRMTSLSESDLYVTIPRFSVVDIRPDTKPEMHLMLGSSTDAFGQTSTGNTPFILNMGDTARTNSHTSTGTDFPNSTMFLMDYRLRSLSKSFVVRVQQSRVLVVLDFLLAVGEFFVPALGTITGREETMDPNNDPISMNRNIVLSQPVHKQKDDVLHLSPNRQLIVDNFEVHEYTYDGCGRTICLSEESDLMEHTSRSRPIIIIGRNKRLRFVNVKIENGSLLKKYTYLNNGSSYSASFDDDVEISFLNNSTSDNEKPNIESMEESSVFSSSFADPQGDSTKMLSYTVDAQVVSSELIFYDGTKSSQNESSHSEKFFRAKMDLNFMYASKETDAWIRALVKDLTVEAGSGLVILDPVDLSGEYTFVRDRSNISLTLTNVCIRLPLSAIALVLTLQSQATEALQFGNAHPLSSCINFDRLWVCPKETGSCVNLTFWRPQAPSKYVILGDCVTSRDVPPSQAVMAVCNIYGRVRKPLDFKIIGSFSSILGLEGESDSDCSLWMPIPPPGYSVVGCVAYPGTRPPPNHIVYCLRSDLVTSTTHSECIFSSSSCPVFQHGISIWRLDNVLGSFYAHLSNLSPPKNGNCDLSYLLLSNSCHDRSSKHDPTFHHVSSETASYSGWDTIRSISRATSCCASTSNFERIWFDKGSDGRRAVSIWRPVPRVGYGILGDYITEGFEQPALAIVFKHDNPELSANPVQFTKVAQNFGKGFVDAFFWYPVPPPGYVSLGCVVSVTDEAPPTEIFCCPRIDLVIQANIQEVPISRSSSSKASNCWGLWKVENQASTFLARADLKMPSRRLAYSIDVYVKPKARENISAVLKLCYLSFTVLDSLCGMMTPLFDITVTNIKLATHGRPEAINATLIASIAASTFNTQLEAWEPLVEPFNGIFKLETFDANGHEASILGKRIHIAATNVLNINLSAANLDTLAQTTVSWRKQIEIEEAASKQNLDCSAHCIDGDELSFPALDQDGYQNIIVDNKLGCDIYVKKLEHMLDSVVLVHHNDHTSVWIPPPRFSDKLNITVDSREAQYYVSVQIYQAKGLCIIDDGSNHNFFCTIRLVVDSSATDQNNIFPQSARTKSIKPSFSNISDLREGDVKWNELFIFEVPRKGKAKLEVEVTNLSAKAGKGEVIGSFFFPIGCGESMLKKVSSARMMHPRYDLQNIVSFPLSRKDQRGNDEDMHDAGCLLVSTSYFERKTPATFQRKARGNVRIEQELGFWVGLTAEGKWQGFRSLLPVSVFPKFLEEDFIAMEVIMRNGKKHVIFRSLATVVNESDINLDISICRASVDSDINRKTSTENTVVEELFENQRYQPISGWGDNWPGLRSNEPKHWSSGNCSYSSKDFIEPCLPPGWKWTSTWIIDKSASVDKDGWAYGVDYQSLTWPPASARSCTKSDTYTVRRRRWIRTRQTITQQGIQMMSNVLSLNAGSSTVLPWKCISQDSDQCMQVRPPSDYPEAPFSWSDVVNVDAGSFGKDISLIERSSIPMQSTAKHGNEMPFSIFKLNELEKKDVLMLCCPSNRTREFWISVGVDAAVLHSELNVPVYDWKISISSPFKLENRLPCSAEFTIWEMKKDETKVERQHGIISSHMNVHIYSVNVQRPIYLTLFIQGGWVLEKDPVLILDLFSQNHASFFWMVQQGSKRRLCVSVERDMGGTHSAPKAIKFFVPYWIANDSFLSLVYHIVEIDPSENTNADPISISKSVKSAKTILKNPTNTVDQNNCGLKKIIQVLDIVKDTTPIPCMLSLQDYTRKFRAMQSSRDDVYLPPKVGISVAVHPSENYSHGISLLDLENKECVDVRAFNSNGSYYRLSAILNITSDRTKVICFQPHTLFINRVGCNLCLQQYDTFATDWIRPADAPKPFCWQSSTKAELLKIQLDGYKWSAPFSLGAEGLMRIPLNSDTGTDQTYVRVEVRSGAKSSQYEVIFRPNSLSSPYRVENCSMFLPICFRQVGGASDSWQSLPPNSAAAFFWEDLGRLHLLELLLNGSDPSKSEKYNIDENSEHQPVFMAGGSSRALHITILKEEKMNVVRVTDRVPNDEATVSMDKRPSVLQYSGNHSQPLQSLHSSSFEFHLNVELTELGISIIDHTPEEILYFFVHDFLLSYSTGLVSKICRLKLKMRGIQVDNQLPLTPTPVLFRPQRGGKLTENILELSITMQSNESLDLCVYPSISLHGPENYVFLINIHEPIIWRLHEMIQKVDLTRICDTQTTAVSVDPIIQIGVISTSDVRLKVSMAMSPSQRPTGVLGFWASLMTAVGNTENMPVRIHQRFHENVCMRRSSLISHAISSVQKDLLSQPLQLLSGVDILGNASSALGHMSKGVAALSLDKKFIQSRQRQENKGVEDIGDVIREGGGALAKGIFRGVTGILTKPLEGAKNSGVEGFVQGVGKGIIGAAAQPVSGVLDLLSKTTEGANAIRMKIASAITSEEQLLRKRFPRVIGGDNLLRPYDEYKAQGQVILQLAESGSFFGQVDLFKVRGKFALTDSYEDHFVLPKGKILVVTHRRVMLLQQPTNIIGQRKFIPSRDRCSVLWDVSWDGFVTMELSHGKNDRPKSLQSQLIIYLHSRSMEQKDQVRIVKCFRESNQAFQIYASIDRAINTYASNQSKEMVKRNVTKPYAPTIDNDGSAGSIPKEAPSTSTRK